jgi:hypothetical protein
VPEADIECAVIDNRLDKGPGSRAHISTVTLRFSPSFGSSPVNLALTNSKAAIAVLAGQIPQFRRQWIDQ